INVLILGSTGFIGKNLVTYLSSNFTINCLSLRNSAWEKNIDNSNVFINLIGKAHDHKGKATKDEYYYVNVKLLKNIFEEFIKSSASLFIHISSLAAVEEFESTRPLDEKAFCNPISWYGKSKREAEEWLLNQKLPEGKKLIIIRPPM